MNTDPIYDSIGNDYATNRVPDPRIEAQIWRALEDANTVCNIGAGTGSYEPRDRYVTPVEPSGLMRSQHHHASKVVDAIAESLPFDDGQFDASMTILSLHHWSDFRQGLSEMKRVSRRQVIMTFDPDRVDSLWLVRDYLPRIAEMDKQRAPAITSIVDEFDHATTEIVEIPWDCVDGFQAAFWRRPEMYLDAERRQSISSIAKLPTKMVEQAMSRLESDVKSGAWAQRYRELLSEDSMDFGYRLVIAE